MPKRANLKGLNAQLQSFMRLCGNIEIPVGSAKHIAPDQLLIVFDCLTDMDTFWTVFGHESQLPSYDKDCNTAGWDARIDFAPDYLLFESISELAKGGECYDAQGSFLVPVGDLPNLLKVAKELHAVGSKGKRPSKRKSRKAA